MKCPKCSYLGFETGDRCKNCGYDFSLMAGASDARDPDLPLHGDATPVPVGSPEWDRFDSGVAAAPPGSRPLVESAAGPLAPLPADTLAVPPPVATPVAAVRTGDGARRAARAVAPSLPLFQRAIDDDEPLVKLPAAPRPPLAVRRTPDKPRLRSIPKPVSPREAAPAAVAVAERGDAVLQFTSEAATAVPPVRRAEPAQASSPARRLGAAAIDHALLTGIDLVVVYFTLKMAALAPGDWRLLPPLPLVSFLAMIKAGYFCVFTLVGGQTLGKMATGIRVVTDDDRGLDPSRAIRRTLAGALSVVTLGLAFLPALLGDRRALHDRMAQTRVIELP